MAQGRGDLAGARARYTESLALRRRLGDRLKIAEGLEGLAGALAAAREDWRAAWLLGVATALREEIGALGEPAFAAAWDAGRALTLDRAVVQAIDGAAPMP